MMRLRFVSTLQIHHENDRLPAIRRCTAYLVICKGYELFISLRVTHFVLPSFHWKKTSTLFFVSLQRFVPVFAVMNASWFFTSGPSYLWLIISSNRTWWFTSPLTWANMFSAIALATRKTLYPSLFYTSYILVSRIGFALCSSVDADLLLDVCRLFVFRVSEDWQLTNGTVLCGQLHLLLHQVFNIDGCIDVWPFIGTVTIESCGLALFTAWHDASDERYKKGTIKG